MNLNSRSTSRAFSLIELIVSLGVLGILLGLAVPGFADYRAKQAMRSASERLLVSLWLARTEAITGSQHTLVCSSSDGQSCDGTGQWENGWIVFVDSNRNRQFDPAEKMLDRGEAFRTGQLTARSVRSRSKIRYNMMGYSPGTNVTITFCDERGPNHAAALIVSNTGRPRQVRGPLREPRCL